MTLMHWALKTVQNFRMQPPYGVHCIRSRFPNPLRMRARPQTRETVCIGRVSEDGAVEASH